MRSGFKSLCCLLSITCFVLSGFSLANNNNKMISLLVPQSEKIITKRTFHHIVGKSNSDDIFIIECSYPYDKQEVISVLDKEEKDDFPKQIQRMFPKDFLITDLNIAGKMPGNVKKTANYKFEVQEEVNLKKFWQSMEFRKVLAVAYNDSISEITVSFKGFNKIRTRVGDPEYQEKWNNIFVFNIPLHPGLNNIQLKAKNKNNKILNIKEIQIFSNPIWFNNDEKLDDFTPYTFHDMNQQSNCESCHDMKIANKNIAEAGDSFCQQCHNEIYSMQYVHAPIQKGECLECHLSGKNFQHSETRQGVPVCESCHNNFNGQDTIMQFIHSPVEQQNCSHCHNAHGSQLSSSLMNQPILNTCLSCHDEKLNNNHPLVGHPVFAKKNPINEEQEFNCISCHNSHRSNDRMFLKKEANCKACHPK